MKKGLSLLLTLAILLCALPVNAAGRFTDVREKDWFYEGVMDAVDKQLFYGTSDTTFSPHKAMDRGMFVTVLGKLAGIQTQDYKNNGAFKDVPDDAYYTAYVNWAVKKGICVGIGYNMFAPNRPITREESMLMLYHYTKAYEVTLEKIDDRPFIFTDIRNLSSISREAINAMAGSLVVDGRTATTFDAKAHLTRAEAAHIMVRVYYIYNDLWDRLTAKPELTGEAGIFTIDLPPQWKKRVTTELKDNHFGTDDGNYYLTVYANMTNVPPELLRIDVVAENGTRSEQFYKNGKVLKNYQLLNRIGIDGERYMVFLNIEDVALSTYKDAQLITFRRIWLARDLALKTLAYSEGVTIYS